MTLNPYAIYIEVGVALALLSIAAGTGYYLGGLGPTAALEADRAEQSQTIATAVLAERASAAATAARDHATEATHAKVIVSIDSAPALRTPVFVCSDPGPLRIGTVSGAEGEASGGVADPPEGRRERVDRERDIRPGIEALKRQLEKVMADYRQEDAEWPAK